MIPSKHLVLTWVAIRKGGGGDGCSGTNNGTTMSCMFSVQLIQHFGGTTGIIQRHGPCWMSGNYACAFFLLPIVGQRTDEATDKSLLNAFGNITPTDLAIGRSIVLTLILCRISRHLSKIHTV